VWRERAVNGLAPPIVGPLSHHPWSFSSILFCLFSTHSFVEKRMPPKKAQVQEKKVLPGRPSNNLKIGIVGAYLRFSWMGISNLPQDFQMSGNHLSSMTSPRQVNTPNIAQ
jgi:hypothetical protein